MAHRWPTSPPPFDSPPHSRSSTSYRSQHRPPSRSPHASRTHSRGTLPLTIQSRSRPASPPPVLPPPQTIPGLEEGRDISWEWQNSGRKRVSESRPVSPRTDSWDRRENLEHRRSTSGLWDNQRRESSASTSTVRSPAATDVFDMNFSRDETYSSFRSSGSISQLQGERPLEKQNRKDSSHAYDNQMKSKIGRPKTPSRSSTAGSIDASPAATKSRTGSLATRPPQIKTLSLSDRLSDRSLSASSESPFKATSPFSSKFAHSPQSTTASPGLVSSAHSAQSYTTDLQRSPTFDVTSVASSHTSFGGSFLSEMAGEPKFGRVKPSSVRSRPTDSNLSLAMMAVSAANSAASSSSPSSSSQHMGKNALSGFKTHSAGYGSGHVYEQGVVGGGAPGMFNRTTSFEQLSGNATTPSEAEPENQHPPLAALVETGGDMRHLQLDDYPPPQIGGANNPPPFSRLHSQSSRSGMKRKASPPPGELPHEEVSRQSSASAPAQAQAQAPQSLQHQLQGAASEQQRRTPAGQQHLPFAKRASPAFHLSHHTNNHHHNHPPLSHPSHSSSSSTALSANGSYASPPFSVGASNVATAPSQQDRLSPAATVKPLNRENHPSLYMNTLSLDPGLQGSGESQSQSQFSVDTAQQLAAAAAQKVSDENASRMKQQNPPRHSASHHICDCCPKKPKKFDTQEELRQHQAEKQYVCQYCHNRFKNKNEAERHQNSLHLRRHSWSCATLERNFEAAFHPCTAVPPNTSSHTQPQHPPGTIAPYDVCGYCGEEFTNIPQPDWLTRGEHLTHIHKFSECNQSKKFYRADHFRQHLKHSHGGTSGKWTNMLEAACMKEEPPVTPEAQSQEQLRQQQQQQQQQQAQAAHVAQQAVQQSQVEVPVLTQYQAAQLQGASGAPVANMMGQSGMRQGPYPAMPMGPMSSEVQFGAIPEEDPKQ